MPTPMPTAPPTSPTRGTRDRSDADDPTLTTPAFPFDSHPYTRVPRPLGATGTEPRIVWQRAILAGAIAWVPLLVLAVVDGVALRADPHESLLLDISAYARYVIALPLLFLVEHIVLPRLGRIARHFGDSGLVPAHEQPRYHALLMSSHRLLSSPWAAAVMLTLAYLATLQLTGGDYTGTISHWAAPITDGVRSVSLAGRWRALVSQPLYIAVVGLWLWRAVVWGRLLYRLSRLDLHLVASHPDEMGGLRFVNESIRAFSMVGFAMATGMAGNIAQRVLFQNQTVPEYLPAIGMVVVVMVLLFAGPVIALRGPLKRLRVAGMMRYGELATGVGVRFERRWLRPNGDVTNDALSATDFSAVTDLYAIVTNVANIRLFPIVLRNVVPLIIATLLPFVPVLALVVPMSEMLRFAVNFLL